jgi:ABC-2 type transport system ATP-binding protein
VVDGRQTPRQYLTYLGNLRGGVPRAEIETLAERYQLNLDIHIGSLSKGNRQKVGLVQAFMHTPELLILDEPTSGLDPLVAREFLAMVDESRQAGQTVFMSSHILSEVQHVADRAAIIRKGKLVAVDEVEELRSRAVRRVEITFATAITLEPFADVAGVADMTVEGNQLRCRLVGQVDGLIKAAAQFEVVDFISEEPDLEELFFHYYAGDEDVA